MKNKQQQGKTKKVLIVTYAFPPVNVVGASRPFFFSKYLPAKGWEPIILCRGLWEGASVDNELTLPENNPTEVMRCKDTWDYPLFRNRIVSTLLKPFFIPDEFVLWNVATFFKTLKILMSRPIDVVLCTVPPVSSLFGALAAAKVAKVPFISDFRDLWSLNEYQQLKTGSRFRSKIEEWLEKMVVTYSNLVIWNTQLATSMMRKKYPALVSKFATISNGVDLQSLSKIKPGHFNKFTITYAGSFYQQRNPNFFLTCLAEWIAEKPEAKGNLQVIFAGKNVMSYQDVVLKQNLGDIVQFHNQLPKNEIYAYLKASHLLIVFLGLNPVSQYVVPAKLYEYLAMNKPVLAFVPENGAAKKLLEKAKLGVAVTRPDKALVKKALSAYYGDYLAGRLDDRIHFSLQSCLDEFDYGNLSDKLCVQLEQTSSRRKSY